MKPTILSYQRIHLLFTAVGLFLFISSCNFFNREETEEPIARVKDKYLYKSDISNLISDQLSGEDSAAVVSNYVQNWINEMLLLDKAEINLKENQKNFEKQLENYRNSLLIYTYEKKIIQQKLDTVVSLQEIEDYYLTNQQNFTLKEEVLKVIYARISKNAPQLEKIRKVYPSSRERDHEEFLDYCHQFAMSFYEEDDWITAGDLLKQIPLKSEDPVNFLKRNNHFELSDSVSHYFVKVRDLKSKGATSPLSFENERIRSIIINQRKLSLLKRMKQDIYKNALAKKDFEIYDK